MAQTQRKPEGMTNDPRIGQLVRSGRTVFYAYVGTSRRYFEHDNVSSVAFQLWFADRKFRL